MTGTGNWFAQLRVLLVLWAILAGEISARAAIPLREKKVGVVFSESSRDRFYDAFAYSSLFMTMQYQTMMAGVPFDLLSEEDLTDVQRLKDFSVLIFPYNDYIRADLADDAVQSILAAANEGGVSIIAASRPISHDQTGRVLPRGDILLRQLLGMQVTSRLNKAEGIVRAADTTHPAVRRFTRGQEILFYDDVTAGLFGPINAAESSVLAEFASSDQVAGVVFATKGARRHVHFAAPDFIGNADLLWSAIHWCLYGEEIPIGLKTSRFPSLFLARADMDESMRTNQVPRVGKPVDDLLGHWKTNFNFVSSLYINIGTNIARGETTHWSISGPLYQSYLRKGNEIGTHSYTHPLFTSQLNDAELEFQFKDSLTVMNAELGIQANGAAIPGNPETLFVAQELNKYLSFLSGRYFNIGSGYPGGFGWLTPDYQMVYLSLNLDPDFTLIQLDRLTAEEAEAAWKAQMATLAKHTWQPWFHWLWHDYGPTVGTNAGYNSAMFSNTIAHAHQIGSEFVLQGDMHNRIKAMRNATLGTRQAGHLLSRVTGTNFGAFALTLPPPYQLAQVKNWYAFSSNAVFLPEEGGGFLISIGPREGHPTHISSLPMRAKLISVTGNGSDLDFSFAGEGEVIVSMNSHIPIGASWTFTGADEAHPVGRDARAYRLIFRTNGTHTATVRTAANHPPVTNPDVLTVVQGQGVSFVLPVTDPDDTDLRYSLTELPQHGILSGQLPSLVYTPGAAFHGLDRLRYTVRDKGQFVTEATIYFEVRKPNVAPTAAAQTITVSPESVNEIVLGGTDPEGARVTVKIIEPPRSGVVEEIDGNWVYRPAKWFVGEDQFSFSVSDGELESAPALVKISVQPDVPLAPVWNGQKTITLDGHLQDWANLVMFPIDPAEYPATTLLDFLQAGLAHDAEKIYIAVRTENPFVRNFGFNIFIDADSNDETGYRFGVIGADYLFQSSTLYRHTGADRNTWGWGSLADADISINGKMVEYALARNGLGQTGVIRMVFHADNAANGAANAPDEYPDNMRGDGVGLNYFSYNLSVTPPGGVQVTATAISTGKNKPATLHYSAVSPSGGPLTFVLLKAPAHGVLSGPSINPVYTPRTDFTGTDQFIFSVADGATVSAPVTVRVDVGRVALSAGLQDHQFVLSWDDISPHWALEETLDLRQWTPMLAESTVNAGRRIVRLPVALRERFFRVLFD